MCKAGRRKNGVRPSGAVPAWKFERRPEGEGTCVLLGWEVSFLFSVQYNLGDYHSGGNRKNGLKREEHRGISYYYFKFLAAS